MFKLILGAVSAGKDEYIYRLVAKNAQNGAYRQIVLVPETLSHNAERALCCIGGDSISLRSEVLTFTRLSNRVLTAFGGLADSVLDDGGRLLLMHRAYSLVRSKLALYDNVVNTAELLSGLLNIVDELKSSNITPRDMEKIMAQCDGRLKTKLNDIYLIYSAYCALCERGIQDPRDILTRVGDLLTEHPDFYEGTTIYLHGFSGFTPQETRIIKELIRSSDEAYAAFDCLSLDDAAIDCVYTKSAKNALKLRSYAMDCGKRIETIVLSERKEPSDIRFLENNFAGYSGEFYDGIAENIILYTALTPYSECEYAAAQIYRRLHDSDKRFRDFAVLLADPDSYKPTLEAVFEQYKIPLFVSEHSDILMTPAAACCDAALRCVTDNFENSDVFKYLKTYLTPVSSDDINIIENYCLKYDICGKYWTSERAWNMNPDGLSAQISDDNKLLLSQINEIRIAVRTPLIKLMANLKSAHTGREKAAALYTFLEDIALFDTLSARSENFRTLGELTKADEYLSIWNVICECLDSFVNIVGDMPIGNKEFHELFTLCLSSYDISVIPSSIDRVLSGPVSSIGSANVKTVIILGVCEGILPSMTRKGGILSDPDREILEAIGVELSDLPSLRAYEEQLSLLKAFAVPTDKLYVCHSITDLDGSAKRPSAYIHQLQKLLPNCIMDFESTDAKPFKLYSRAAAIDYAISRTDTLSSAIFEALDDSQFDKFISCDQNNRDNISNTDVVSAIYGQKIRLSPSRIDCFNSCRYMYFTRYGLKLKPRKKITFDAPEAGTFLHYVLENTVRDAENNFKSFGHADVGDIQKIAESYICEYITSYLNDFEDKSQRFIYLFSRLKSTVFDLLSNFHDEFMHSSFHPTDFELNFSSSGELPPISVAIDENHNAEFGGTVDRVDAYADGDTLYVRVADYKSGTKTFSYADLMLGISLQMPLYLFAIEDTFSQYKTMHEQYKNIKNFVPAGLLYVPARIPIITSNCRLDDAQYAAALNSKLTRSGIVSDDPILLNAMEDTALTSPQYLPIKVNKNGTLGKNSYVANENQFALIERYVRKALTTIASLIYSGYLEANPICDGAKVTCEYCDFRHICNFNPEVDMKRYKKSVKQEEFFDNLRDEFLASNAKEDKNG